LYLLFDDENFVNSGDYIFNTEGHLFPLSIKFHLQSNISKDARETKTSISNDLSFEEEENGEEKQINGIIIMSDENEDLEEFETKSRYMKNNERTRNKEQNSGRILRNKCVWTFLDSLSTEDFPLHSQNDD
jgi:hypothetical protein